MLHQTNKRTRELNARYPRGTVVMFRSKTGYRSGLVLKAKNGLLAVRSPALAAMKPRDEWGTTCCTPWIELIYEKFITQVMDRYGKHEFLFDIETVIITHLDFIGA